MHPGPFDEHRLSGDGAAPGDECRSQIAKNACRSALPATKRAQANLMRKFGVLGEQEHVTAKALDDYARLFLKLLVPEQITALAAMFV